MRTKDLNRSISKSTISRRDFLRLAAALGSLTTGASFLPACAPASPETPTTVSPLPATPTATSSPTLTLESPPTLPSSPTAAPSPSSTAPPTSTVAPTPSPTAPVANTARIAFVKTRDRAEGVQRALDLLGLNPVRGKTVCLKPNFNSSHPAPGSTHDETLRTLVQQLWQMGARAITVADRSGMADTRQAMQRKGIFTLAEELGFETLVLDELKSKDWVMIEPPDSHWEQGFLFARPFLEAEAVIQTCCLKTHRFGGHFTMSLKNSVGMVSKYSPDSRQYDYMGELHSSAHQRLMIAEINVAYTPALVVMDGVQAFVSGGPESGEQVWAEVVVAGTDRVAIDAVGVAVLRHFGTTREVSQGPIFQQEQIARAVELGLGVDKPENIELITADAESEAYAAQIRDILRRE
jgi:uncharacterized protein (DUF362 family)